MDPDQHPSWNSGRSRRLVSGRRPRLVRGPSISRKQTKSGVERLRAACISVLSEVFRVSRAPHHHVAGKDSGKAPCACRDHSPNMPEATTEAVASDPTDFPVRRHRSPNRAGRPAAWASVSRSPACAGQWCPRGTSSAYKRGTIAYPENDLDPQHLTTQEPLSA